MADDYEYVPLIAPPAANDEPSLWFAFKGAELLVETVDGAPAIPLRMSLAELALAPVRTQYLGMLNGRHCYATELPEDARPPEGGAFSGLRALFGEFDDQLVALAGRAFQIKEWDRNHQFCGRCGTPTRLRTDERSRACPECRYTSYPPVSPAVMILITDGRRLLLGRKAEWPENRYSALAGFVEPGETLEDTVRRETMEEVGVKVGALRYFGSQPWPFPHSLMVAFIAEYAGGEVRPDGVEIAQASWFEPDQLPRLPPSISISRRLIDATAKELLAGRG
jgi:NAD+ diphosphatase